MENKTEPQYFDIIGDVHGHATELKALLKQMGYTIEDGLWQHEQRKAVFVGDFTCRGPESREAINIVRNMVENGSAYAIIGNHELNLIGHFTKDTEGLTLKKATGSNKKMMDKIREEYAYEKKQLKDDLKWLRKLPFSLDFKDIRIVHAYWSPSHLNLISETIGYSGKLTKELLKEIFSSETDFALAVRQTTRGVEINLPHDLIIKDNLNVRRTNFRIKWWESPYNKTFRQIGYGNKFLLPDYTIPQEIIYPFEVYTAQSPLVMIGHYCVDAKAMMPAPNVCCMDNCVANGGRLAAYRWNGEKTLNPENLIFQEKVGN